MILAHGMKGSQTLEQSIDLSSHGPGGNHVHFSSLSDGDLNVQSTFSLPSYISHHAESRAPRSFRQIIDPLIPTIDCGQAKLVTTVNHPDWKQPHVGVTHFSVDRPIAWNFTKYARDSMQRHIPLDTHWDVEYGSSNGPNSSHTDNNCYRCCLGASVELMPGSPLKRFYNINNEDLHEEENEFDELDDEEALQRRRVHRFMNFQLRDVLYDVHNNSVNEVDNNIFKSNNTAALRTSPRVLAVRLLEMISNKSVVDDPCLVVTETVPRVRCSCNSEKVLKSLLSLPRRDLEETMASALSDIKVKVLISLLRSTLVV